MSFLWIPVCFMVVGSIFLYAGISFKKKIKLVESKAKRFAATVVDNRWGGRIAYPVVKFKDESGQEITRSLSQGTNRITHQVGSTIYILYTPDEPDMILEAGGANDLISIIFIVLGSIFLGVGSLILLLSGMIGWMRS